MPVAALVLFVAAQLAGQLAPATLDAALYWELTQARLELAEQEWRERVESARQAAGNTRMLNTQSATISKAYAARQIELLRNQGLTEQDFRHFASDHSREIESYLDENDAVRQGLSSLRQALQGLMEQFDTLAKTNSSVGTPQ